jgi:hypothetical protein
MKELRVNQEQLAQFAAAVLEKLAGVKNQAAL